MAVAQSDQSLYRARIVSSIAATLISLACGTNYVYSAWGPQFAEKLLLSSTQQNLIGLSGNLGMYSLGIPVGMLVDRKGPRLAVFFGAILLAVGYFGLHRVYDKGGAPLPILCILSYSTGLGGCAAFAASIKTSALNWPHSRGTATGIPLAAFGLSAFFFSLFAQFVFPGNTGHFLLVLACGTFGLVAISWFFLRVLPHPHYNSTYSALPANSGLERVDSNQLHTTRSTSKERKSRKDNISEPGRSTPGEGVCHAEINGSGNSGFITSETDETSSLMSRSSTSVPGDISEENNVKDHAHRVDIRGVQLLGKMEFWHQFLMMGILAGIGLMTINNIGNDAKALWSHYDDTVTDDFITKRQAMHVSILSVCSFTGRFLSGVGSDFLVKVLHASRLWCLTAASALFLIAQVLALNIETPHLLVLVSGLTGLAYGFLFGCFPSLVAEAFGIHGLSTNWGFMTLSPVVSGNVFNLFYGTVYDKHSIVEPNGERSCDEGLSCYRSAYVMTSFACGAGLAVSLWSIYHTHRMREEEEKALEAAE